jgi:hypothetical protein
MPSDKMIVLGNETGVEEYDSMILYTSGTGTVDLSIYGKVVERRNSDETDWIFLMNITGTGKKLVDSLPSVIKIVNNNANATVKCGARFYRSSAARYGNTGVTV